MDSSFLDDDSSFSSSSSISSRNEHFSSSQNSCDNFAIDIIPSEIKCSEVMWLDDDDQSAYYDFFDDTVMTEPCSDSDDSAGNASINTIDVYEIYDMNDQDEIYFNFRGPKVLPINDTPVTICTANTIGTLRSRKMFRVLFDSGTNKVLINRSALPNGIIPRELNETKKNYYISR